MANRRTGEFSEAAKAPAVMSIVLETWWRVASTPGDLADVLLCDRGYKPAFGSLGRAPSFAGRGRGPAWRPERTGPRDRRTIRLMTAFTTKLPCLRDIFPCSMFLALYILYI